MREQSIPDAIRELQVFNQRCFNELPLDESKEAINREYSSFIANTFDFGSLLHTGLCSKLWPKSSYLGYIFRILYKLNNRELSILLRYQRTHKLSLQLKLNLVAEALNYEH